MTRTTHRDRRCPSRERAEGDISTRITPLSTIVGPPSTHKYRFFWKGQGAATEPHITGWEGYLGLVWHALVGRWNTC